MGTYIKKLKKYDKPSINKHGLTIIVNGLSGSGKDTVARAIAHAFKLKFINTGDIHRHFAKKQKIHLDQASAILPKKVDYQMDKQTLKLAKKGGYVITGRLVGWVAGDHADCRIFVDCLKKVRAQRISKRDKLSHQEAIKKVNLRDQADRRRYFKLYDVDPADKKIYHFVVDNSKPGIKRLERKTIQSIKTLLKKRGK